MRINGHTYVFRKTDDEIDKEFSRSKKDIAEDIEADLKDDSTNIYDWIGEIYFENRGAELPGLPNPQVLQVIFCEQSKAWEEIATKYFEDTVQELKDFQKKLLTALVSDEKVQRNVNNMLEMRSEGRDSRATSPGFPLRTCLMLTLLTRAIRESENPPCKTYR